MLIMTMKDTTKGPILKVQLYNDFLKEIGSGLEFTLRNCDGKKADNMESKAEIQRSLKRPEK